MAIPDESRALFCNFFSDLSDGEEQYQETETINERRIAEMYIFICDKNMAIPKADKMNSTEYPVGDFYTPKLVAY
jgi:hypothetical protein